MPRVGLQAPLPTSRRELAPWTTRQGVRAARCWTGPPRSVSAASTPRTTSTAGLQGRRGHRLPVDVHVRRPARGSRSARPPSSRTPRSPSTSHRGSPQLGSARDVAYREVPEPRVHRPGPGALEPAAVGRGRPKMPRSTSPMPVYARIRCSGRTGPGASSTRGPGSTTCATVDFTFGTRIHGNIAALLAGTTELRPRRTTRGRWSSPATSRSRIGSRRAAAGHGRRPAVRGGRLRSAQGESRQALRHVHRLRGAPGSPSNTEPNQYET